MKTGKNQKRGKGKTQSRDWDEWQRYLQKERQRLLHKSGRKVLELNVSESEPAPHFFEEFSLNSTDGEIDVHKGRHPPVPGVSREEAIQVSDDAIGRTVKPFTVNDYRAIKPLTSAELFNESNHEVSQAVIDEPVHEITDIPDPDRDVSFEIVREEKKKPAGAVPKKKGRKKKQEITPSAAKKAGDLTLFSDDISEYQAISKRRFTRRSRLEREELIEKLLDPVISLDEAATLIGVCKTTVRRYTNRGELDCLRTPGSQRRFKLSQVLEFVKSREDEERTRRGVKQRSK